ncbi:MAG TPA: aspartate 1-decarboxylase [Phycisphaerae bacterium]|nr:aspartate 1-decarboxylase [Phycisphaerae bacterium]HNU44629.1 aspartate 1-decarboxylase [Phycisphaerae bacterium]
MKIEMLKSKLHLACVTDGDVQYEGSLGIDAELMDAVGILPYEKLLVADVNNGARFETYAIAEPPGSRRIVLNGAAARLGCIGDRLIIMTYAWVEDAEVRHGRFRPRVLRLDEGNNPVYPLTGMPTFGDIATMLEG